MKPGANQFTDEEIVAGFQVQDHRILRFLYDNIGPQVFRLISQSGGSMDDAQDIFQDGLLAVYTNIRTGKYQLNSTARFSTYLMQICKYKWYDVRKSAYVSKKTDEGGELPDLPDEPEALFEEEEKIKRLYRLLDQLGEQCKKILHLFYWEKKPLQEVAELTGLEPASAKNQKYRCINRLKELAFSK